MGKKRYGYRNPTPLSEYCGSGFEERKERGRPCQMIVQESSVPARSHMPLDTVDLPAYTAHLEWGHVS
jgi:hypothetical protein